MRVVFAGTPEFAVASLRAIVSAGVDVVTVFTQPDRPSGRGRKTTASPVKQYALKKNIEVRQPKHITVAVAEQLAALQPDVMVVVAYGLILPQALLDVPKFGCINVHGSLLPRWRGAAPIQRAIEAGDSESGISLMQMEAGLDTGPVLATAALAIEANETAQTLHDKLAELGGKILAQALPAIAVDELIPQTQNESLSTYAEKLSKAEALIDWNQSAKTLDRKIRALNPWPVAQTTFEHKPLRIWMCSVSNQATVGKPAGTVVGVSKNAISVQTGEGVLDILTLQKQGGRPLSVKDFLNGTAVTTDSFFG
ncbi:MAG: methionyl-tRNA formyltransferase [Arenicellales bacterium WSBS_2016_MAG_OTU3]